MDTESRKGGVLSGSPTRVWRYRATVNQGDSNKVVDIPESYLGPIINVRQGENIRIRFKNNIPEKSIIHWYGLHVPAIMDGHPRYAVSQGQSFLYEFTVTNRAGTYWYHPHSHGRTGPQVHGGLAGLFLVSDEEELSAGLPENEFDVPLLIQDRTFDVDNQFVYMSRNRMARMTGFLKDTVLLMPGESIRILTDFSDYSGLFLYHCHNLEHEDMGMMRNYFARKN
ncbi:MAG: multicopper oxidase domain-containing protein [Deltaproteobacteria bacterium]|nr:multicopper oxidase domain-containing protein [Deltaproteobacteria bacterium]